MENKYLAQAYKGNTNLWRYVLGFVLIVLGALLFSLPYNVVISNKVASGEADALRIEDLNYLYTLMNSNLSLFYMMLPFVGGMLTLSLVLKKINKQSWLSLTTSRERIDVKRMFFSFLFTFAIYYSVIANIWRIIALLHKHFQFTKPSHE